MHGHEKLEAIIFSGLRRSWRALLIIFINKICFYLLTGAEEEENIPVVPVARILEKAKPSKQTPIELADLNGQYSWHINNYNVLNVVDLI